MNSIKLLDAITIQQIAAGEIIDRPASIVKEIVENSMDANSNSITIEIKNGGKSYIRVTDNGAGINTEDIELAFKRHSTSKLNTAEDLYDIHSFGFRGEALASISAVSKIELMTKTRNSDGTQSFIEDGKVIKTEKIGCPNGTTIIMKDIFYNLPVRKNFLKSDSVETNRITDTISRLAIGNPDISFKYIKDDRVVFKTPGKGELLQTIFSVLGREFNENLIELEYNSKDIKLSGFISKNSFYRSNRSHQYLYVNNRLIYNGNINSIIENQYKSLIPINRFPIYFLFININPEKVDVNIHPTKQEINFSEQDEINEIIENTIKNTLKKSLEIQSIPKRVNDKVKEEIPLLYESTFFDMKNEDVDEIPKAKSEIVNPDPTKKIFEKINYNTEDPKEIYNRDYNITNLMKEDDDNYIKLVEENDNDILVKESEVDSLEMVDNIQLSKREEFENIIKHMRIIGLSFKTYIIGEDNINKDLILIDQHAAHERIMYEKYLNKYKDSSISTQMLLKSEVIELSDIEYDLFNDNIDFFNNIGFTVEDFGSNSVVIRGVPIIFGEPEPKNIFFDVLDNLNMNINSPYEIKLEKIMKLACTSAVKSGDKLSTMEIEELLNKLLETDTPFTCPHGRPTMIKMNIKDIEKDFKRIM